MSKRVHLIQKYVVFNMLAIATQNTSPSLYPILTLRRVCHSWPAYQEYTFAEGRDDSLIKN